MVEKCKFGVFQDDKGGALWRISADDLGEAKQLAQNFADHEKREFFVFSFVNFTEVVRAMPSRRKSTSGRAV